MLVVVVVVVFVHDVAMAFSCGRKLPIKLLYLAFSDRYKQNKTTCKYVFF